MSAINTNAKLYDTVSQKSAEPIDTIFEKQETIKAKENQGKRTDILTTLSKSEENFFIDTKKELSKIARYNYVLQNLENIYSPAKQYTNQQAHVNLG